MERSWRLIATALSFALFGAGAVIVSLSVLLPLALFCRPTALRQRLGRTCVASGFRALLSILALLRVFKFELDRDGLAQLSADGGLVVANHPTLIDVVVLLAYIEQGNCVVKSAVWRNPILSWAVRLAGYVPNGNAEDLLQACEASLRDGETLILFPEATRTTPGRSPTLRRGAANVALRADAVVHIVHFRCDPPLLSKHDPWYRVPERRPRFAAYVGRRLRARDYLRDGESIALAARRLTNVLQAELTREIPFNENPGTGTQAVTH